MSFQEFIAMNGYGLYVWGSYGLATLVFLVMFVLVKQQRKKLIKQLNRRYKLKAKQQNNLVSEN